MILATAKTSTPCHQPSLHENTWGRKVGRPGGGTAPCHGRPYEVIFIVSRRRLWRDDRPLRKEFLGCRAGAADSRPQAPESRPYRAFHCCGGDSPATTDSSEKYGLSPAPEQAKA